MKITIEVTEPKFTVYKEGMRGRLEFASKEELIEEVKKMLSINETTTKKEE